MGIGGAALYSLTRMAARGFARAWRRIGQGSVHGADGRRRRLVPEN